jgi:predicted phosphodiesterase
VTERQRLAKEILEANPNTSKRRLAMMLNAKHPALFETVERARNCLRRTTGTCGKSNLKHARVQIPNNPRAGSKVYRIPKSTAKPWEPYNTKAKCIAVFSDCHFPVHDPEAIEAAVAHVKENFEPDTVLLNGDFADAIEFGSWAKSPKAIQTENSLATIRAGLLYFRAEFPEAKLIYKFGNHEDRLERFCWERAPELVGLEHVTWKGLLTIDNDLKKVSELDDLIWIGEERPIITNGGLAIFHGHELPRGLTNAVNPARGAFLRTRDSVMIGHHHQSSSHVEYSWKKEPVNCWSVGCLCELSPRYARINKWNLGHAVVEAEKNSFSVSNFKQLSDNRIVRA